MQAQLASDLQMSNYLSLGNEKEIDKFKCYISVINISEYRKKESVRKKGKKPYSTEDVILNTSMEKNVSDKGQVICLRVGWHVFFQY